jgi:hypothetical protein
LTDVLVCHEMMIVVGHGVRCDRGRLGDRGSGHGPDRACGVVEIDHGAIGFRQLECPKKTSRDPGCWEGPVEGWASNRGVYENRV